MSQAWKVLFVAETSQAFAGSVTWTTGSSMWLWLRLNETLKHMPLCLYSQHIWRFRRTCTLPYTHPLFQSILYWSPSHAPKILTWSQSATVSVSVFEEPIWSGHELHDMAWRSTIEICNICEFWRHYNYAKGRAHRILARSDFYGSYGLA